ncbi:MAG: hypothetical protein ACP5VE_12495 [Chthonomonadales bacterium]
MRRACGLYGERGARHVAVGDAYSLWRGGPRSAFDRPRLWYMQTGRPRLVAPRAFSRTLCGGGAHISIAHDGGVLAVLVAGGSGVCGVGVDIVDLSRLRRRIESHRMLERFAGHIADGPAARRLAADWKGRTLEGGRVEAGVRFALMEAVSKALGTGWTLGRSLGVGVPCKAIEIGRVQPAPQVTLKHPAVTVLRKTGGRRVRGLWIKSGDLIVAVAAVLRSGS